MPATADRPTVKKLKAKMKPEPDRATMQAMIEQLTRISKNEHGDSNAALGVLADSLLKVIPYELIEEAVEDVERRPGDEKPDNELPDGPGKPPTWGGDEPGHPGRPDKPDHELPEKPEPPRPDIDPPDTPDRPGAHPDHELPDKEKPEPKHRGR